MSNIIFYRCEVCGNILALLKNGGGTLTCCEQGMTRLAPNTTDGSKEKHLPFITKGNGKINVSIGSTVHPMLPEHHIEWIALDTGEKTEIVYFKPDMEPKAGYNISGVLSTIYCHFQVSGNTRH